MSFSLSKVSLNRWLLFFGILLIAANLRAPMTAIAPLFAELKQAFNLSSAQVGLLTSLPLIILAIISPLCARLASLMGLKRALGLGLIAIVAGVFTRSFGSLSWLYSGTILLAIGIAIGNVLLPPLVKTYFPTRISLITTSYGLTMGISAGVLSAIMIPIHLSSNGNWQFALACSGLVAVAALLVWLPQFKGREASTNTTPHHASIPVWRSSLAWQVTGFMGINSFVYYTMVGWLPTMATDAGFSGAYAGNAHGAMQLASAFSGISLLAILPRLKDQRFLALCSGLFTGCTLIALYLAPNYTLLWATLFGFFNGVSFILALSFIGLRTQSPTQTAALSGMAQCFGYLLAALGPSLMGAVRDSAGSFMPVLVSCFICCLCISILGFNAGKNRQIPLQQ